MASFKDSSTSRPLPQAIPNPRQSSNGRTHSHSVSLGALNYNHRVTRRKSMTSSAANSATAAATAAIISESGASTGSPIHTSHHRRGLSLRRAAGLESTSVGSSTGFGSYARNNMAGLDRKQTPGTLNSSAIAEELSTDTGKPISIKHRSRRASEGSHLMKGEGKRSLVELKCDRCGKGYKHSSCLTKHMWEHDPAWAVTSKLLISKHQQVQLLEAASVLVTLNEPSSDDSAIRTAGSGSGESDRSSTSPTVSGISELRDGLSSTETTPPPTSDDGAFSKSNDPYRYPHNHHNSNHNNNHSFSRSLQSIPSSSFASASSVPSYSPARSHFRQSSTDTRPSTADTNGVLDDDAAGLAAAIELCNFGTPRSGPMAMAEDVPPVPPLPARFLGQSVGSTMTLANNHANGLFGSNHGTTGSISNNNLSNGSGSSISGTTITAANLAASTPTAFNTLSMSAHAPISYRVSDERDVKMADIKPDIAEHDKIRNSSSSPSHAQKSGSVDDDFDRASPSSVVHMDDDDDGVFGRMEE